MGFPAPQHQPPIKKRLPLPKNVVLLSLIEATELATLDVQKKYSSDEQPGEAGGGPSSAAGTPSVNLHSRPAVYSMNSMIDADEDEEEKIRVGTSVAVGVAGTYAVAARDGLTIVPNRPTASTALPRADAVTKGAGQNPEEDVDSLVQNMHTEVTAKNEKESPKKSTSTDNKDCGRLSFGDRVQVVSIDGGWAKLARGYGYVKVDKNSLVKGTCREAWVAKNPVPRKNSTVVANVSVSRVPVGGSVDRACKVEAMLRALSHRRKELRIEQSKIDNQFIRLLNDLQLSLEKEEDLTVIAADAFAEPREALNSSIELVINEKKEDERSAAARSPAEQRNDFETNLVKPSRLPEQVSSAVQPTRSSFVCFAGDVFSSYTSDFRTTQPITPSSPANSVEAITSLFPTTSHPSPSALRAGAQAWRERHGRQANQGIDFRTGMSGHMALLSTHGHPHEYLEPASSYSSSGGYHFPRMSSHTGLTMAKPSAWGRALLSSLTLPTFGISSSQLQQDDGGREGVQQAGSM
jgi:hypothetical protein